MVEAYMSSSDRLLWRSGERDKKAAYDLALKADKDPRIEIRILEVQDGDDAPEVRVVLDETS